MIWVRTAAFVGALGVLLAAVGAHGLEKIASATELEWWHTGNLLHLVTAPVLLAFGILQPRVNARHRSGWLLSAGLLLFSGSLYAMALGAPRVLGAVTPFGGLCLIAGWLSLAFDVQPARSSRDTGG